MDELQIIWMDVVEKKYSRFPIPSNEDEQPEDFSHNLWQKQKFETVTVHFHRTTMSTMSRDHPDFNHLFAFPGLANPCIGDFNINRSSHRVEVGRFLRNEASQGTMTWHQKTPSHFLFLPTRSSCLLLRGTCIGNECRPRWAIFSTWAKATVLGRWHKLPKQDWCTKSLPPWLQCQLMQPQASDDEWDKISWFWSG